MFTGGIFDYYRRYHIQRERERERERDRERETDRQTERETVIIMLWYLDN